MKPVSPPVDWHTAARVLSVALLALAVWWAFASPGGSPPSERSHAGNAVLYPRAAAGYEQGLPTVFAPIEASGTPGLVDEAAALDAPELLGLAGRLPDDVEVLVRNAEGGTSALRVGDSLLGWTLVSVAADRAVFERDGRQAVRTLN